MTEHVDPTKTFHGVAEGYEKKFQDWWSTARQSEEPPHPYDFLVHFGMPVEAAQTACWDILAESCRNDDLRPGNIDYNVHKLFFTDKVRHESFSTWRNQNFVVDGPEFERFDDLLEAAAMVEDGPGPTNQDIKSLVDLVTLTRRDWDDERQDDNYPSWDLAVKQFITSNFDAEVLQYVFNGFAVSSSNLEAFEISESSLVLDGQQGRRTALDRECMLGIQKILPRIAGLEMCEPNWKRDAFLDLMEMLVQTKELYTVRLKLSTRFVDDSDDNNSESLSVATAHRLEHLSRNSVNDINSFILDVSAPQDDQESERPGCKDHLVFQMLPCLVNLERIHLELAHLPSETTFSCIVQMVQNAPSLRLLMMKVADAPADASRMLSLLEALRNAPLLADFFYQEGLRLDASRIDTYEEKLLEILQERNISLTLATVQGIFFRGTKTGAREKIDYYLDLNKHGRSLARDPNTDLEEFVALLSRISSQVRMNANNPLIRISPRAKSKAANRLYGLLRELPGTWSGGSVANSVGNRKRKAPS